VIAPPPPSSTTSCGDGLSVNRATSCSFARNVRDAYQNGGGASVVRAFSPVTGKIYSMTCSSGLPTVCTGGNNAVVTIR
jgi:serine/threonine-protein kinase